MKTERQENILKEIQELKRRLSLVERRRQLLQKPEPASVRAAFQRKYPHIRVDPQIVEPGRERSSVKSCRRKRAT